ncbi:MAG TPA: DNA polymerase IV [Dialister sp.]|nr:DNA polymerase IV [Dialister sp.]
MRRWIMHVDMDAFFASVEQRDDPALQGKPVIVGGKSRRSVVATASYEARAFGVHSAMPLSQAKRLCPHGCFVAPRFEAYREASDAIHQVMLHYADAYEPISLDEAFLDISGMGNQYPTLGAIGRAIKEEIRSAVHLTASVGIAPNKFLAKMASDMKKPDGLCIIPYGREREVLAPLPVRRLWGVGEVTEKKLLAAGFRTIADIQEAPPEKLSALLGNQGALLKNLSLGIDDRPVVSSRQVKSIGDESTYEYDLTDRQKIDREIAIHSDIVAQRLRRHDLAARTISLKIRFASFKTIMRSLSLEERTNLQETINSACQTLLSRIPLTEGIRLIGVTASNLGAPLSIPSLFSDAEDKRARAAKAMDSIQQKYGRKALQKGFWLEE